MGHVDGDAHCGKLQRDQHPRRETQCRAAGDIFHRTIPIGGLFDSLAFAGYRGNAFCRAVGIHLFYRFC